ncbi:MAG: DNA (cytosine-5-)-methyltransferase [Bacilli bacterium]|nr:DNA (cytosine-5-)-methyltransferase [Bacilli bacterium]
MKRLKFIDLFAGIGGIRIAFENVGCTCVFSSELDKKCQETYFANFGETPVGDIRSVEEKGIPNHDILVGGFPCQPFSIAGISKNRSLGRETGFEDETRGTLFFEIVRIIKAKRPKAFLLENVKNLKTNDHGRTFDIILSCFKELGYSCDFMVLDGQHYVPQHRERLIMVGFDQRRYGEDVSFSFEMSYPKRKPALADILEAEVADKYTLTDHLWEYLQNRKAAQRAKGNGFGYSLSPVDGISHTLSARYGKDGSEILIPQEGKNPRRLTPRECARLQGFPDSFKIVVGDASAYHQFGNSVVVPLIQDVAKQMLAKLKLLEIKGGSDSSK